MLQFIFGRPATGKTYKILNMIKSDVKDGKNVILLVPEQFSFESERAVLHKLGDAASLNVSVMSFSRICDEVGRNIGGIAGIVLSDADKIIMMNKAMNAVSGDLKIWSRYVHSISFAKTILTAIGEFKTNAVTPIELKKAAEGADSPSLKNKLLDTALIYEMFDILIGEKFIDPADNLTKLYKTLADYKFFKGKQVYLDSFKGFTGQQYRIINRILAQAENTTIGITNDTQNEREYNIFTNIRLAAERIKKSASIYNVDIKDDIYLDKCYYNSESIKNIERLISCGECENHEKDNTVTICHAATAFDEAEFAARTIRKLVKEKNYRYRDFVIIARNTDLYEEAVLNACEKNDISCFMDKRVPLETSPIAVAVNSALLAVTSFSTEYILRFHKTGLGTLSFDEVSALENYTTLWNITGAMWNTEWDMNVRGFISGGELTSEDEKQLEDLNNLRIKAINPLNKFKDNFKGNAADMSAAIVHLLEQCNCSESLSNMCKSFRKNGKGSYSDILKQGYDAYMKLLDSLVRCFGRETLKTAEFCEALKLTVSLTSIGVIPQMLDEVTFGAADRIRPSRPKVAFVLGANQGIFPKANQSGGIFALNERAKLINLGIDISDNLISSSVDESFLVYSNICCPTDMLFISCFERDSTGNKCEPAAFLTEIEKNIACIVLKQPESTVTSTNAPQTAEAAFTEFCERYSTSKNDAFTIKEAIKDISGLSGRLKQLDDSLKKGKQKITPETAVNLFGNNINMSASKFDTFNRCRFSFFCKYGLNSKKLQPADFDVLQRGTLVHFVLERLINDYKKQVSELSEQQISDVVDGYVNEYLDGIKGYRSIETARTRFLVEKMARAIKEVAAQISKEFKQSDFEPKFCELKIGEGGVIPPIKIPFDNGSIFINGSIDRLDEYNGYVRIIDYKTGSRSFKLPDILFGLNLQMLIYLYAVVRGDRDNPGGKRPAGIFYMPSKRDLNGSGMNMNGLVLANPDIVRAMEKENNGEFVPKLKINKDGSVAKTNNSFIDEDSFDIIFDYIDLLMKTTGNKIHSGDIAVSPVDGRESAACKYCDYSAICGIEDGEHLKVPNMKNDEVLEKITEVKNNGI